MEAQGAQCSERSPGRLGSAEQRRQGGREGGGQRRALTEAGEHPWERSPAGGNARRARSAPAALP